mgnify:CR=1 FL=1
MPNQLLWNASIEIRNVHGVLIKYTFFFLAVLPST